MRQSILLVVFVALALRPHTSAAQLTVRRADIDSTGQLRIVLSDSRVISPARDSDQVAFEQVALSTDRRTLGWVALYPNCCTTYPISLKLVLYRASGARTVISPELPIWQWAFAADGRSVVLRQGPVHFATTAVYERRDVRTGRVIATAIASDSTPRRALPAWARAVSRREPS